MSTTNIKKFKGEIENYLNNHQNIFESKIDGVFRSLKFKTWLSRSRIIKKDGYGASHTLFILLMMPLIQIKTVHSFCAKQWNHWSTSKKDVLYRFKNNPKFRWRSFFKKITNEILDSVEIHQTPQKDRVFVIDDTILVKLGKMMDNVSFIYDHNLGRTVLGYCVVALGLFTPKGFYPLDFSFCFGKKRHPKSHEEKLGDPRSVSGLMSYEAKHCTKLELAIKMVKNAVDAGIIPGYVLFDSWYSWPVFINSVRKIGHNIHVICRLKDSKVLYEYKGKSYRLSGLYQKVKHQFKKDLRTGLSLTRVNVKMPGAEDDVTIVFSKNYKEPEIEPAKGRKKEKQDKWVAFLSTDKNLHASSIIKIYTKRWPVEVCFKECKQLLTLGKEQSNDFNAQVFSTMASFLRYNMLMYLNEKENYSTLGELFAHLVDDAALITYADRLWDFFRGLFAVSFSKIFDLFKIEEDFHTYLDALSASLTTFTPIQGCET
jgi:hypothetical protein